MSKPSSTSPAPRGSSARSARLQAASADRRPAAGTRAPRVGALRSRWPLAVLAAAVAGACAGPLEDPSRFVYLLEDGGQVLLDGGDDAGAPDAGEPDAGPDGGDADAGPGAGGADAGPDAGHADAGRPDSGSPDAGRPDAGHPDAGPPDAGHPPVCDPVKTFFSPSCATGLCHGADIQQANLDLASPGMPGRLVGKQANGGPGLLIDPAHPDQSVLYAKVLADPPFNFQMPLAGEALSDVEVQCLLDWVRAAARP